MGSLGNNNGETKPSEINSNTDLETQPFEFDSQFPFFGNKGDNEEYDELNYLQSTVPFDDDNNNVRVEDGGFDDTQVLNLGGGETQVMNFDGETQALDDLDCFENMETQLLDEFDDEIVLDSDSEGTDCTEILDDEIVTSDCGRLSGQEEKKESLEQFYTSKDEQMSSGIRGSSATPDVKAVPKPGSVPRFTSVRAAALRASGLAARNAALRGMNSDSCFIQADSQFSDHCTDGIDGLNNVVGKISQAGHQGDYDADSISLRHGSNNRVGCSTMRKLFAESPCSSEIEDAREDVLQFPARDDSLAGLSYIDSQEPGESSQANALNFVENFVNDNMMELDDEVDLGKSTGRKSKVIPCAIIGPRSLVKKTIERSTAEKTKIFDWDDVLEDEGGGYIYCKRKEEFYGNGSRARKTSNRPHKPKGRKLDESCNEGRQNAHDKVVVDSDSKSLLCKSNGNDKPAQEGQIDFRKNLLNEFEELCSSDSSRGQVETAVLKNKMYVSTHRWLLKPWKPYSMGRRY